MIKKSLLVLALAMALLTRAVAEDVKQDGLSAKTAVVIVAKDEKEGPPKEVAWVRQNYPGSKILRFVTRPSKEGKVYDVFFIKASDGKKQELYFEISSFYHKT
jgi:predicted Zn-dependent protease